MKTKERKLNNKNQKHKESKKIKIRKKTKQKKTTRKREKNINQYNQKRKGKNQGIKKHIKRGLKTLRSLPPTQQKKEYYDKNKLK